MLTLFLGHRGTASLSQHPIEPNGAGQGGEPDGPHEDQVGLALSNSTSIGGAFGGVNQSRDPHFDMSNEGALQGAEVAFGVS